MIIVGIVLCHAQDILHVCVCELEILRKLKDEG
jgi:cellobiose-specific phosphotransferase system component IIA